MRESADVSLERAVDAARRAVVAGGEASLRHWRTALHIERKDDASPVTAADRESEAAILGLLRAEFPGHDVLAEESGASGEGGRYRWVVDPLDGTRGFSRGGTHWGPIVALEDHGTVVAGAMGIPALREVYWAGRGLGAFLDGEPLRLSTVARWEEATLSLGELRFLLAPPTAARMTALITGAACARCHGDVASAAQLLQGRAEAWIEAGVKTWDVAALRVLVEEAGGRVSELPASAGWPPLSILFSNAPLHDALCAALF